MSKQGNAGEELFLPYFERIAARAKKELKSSGLKEGKIMESAASKSAERCMWIPLRCLIFEMHELKEKGMLSGQDSRQMYESYLKNDLDNEKYLAWFDKKYPLIKELINKKIIDTARFIGEMLEHLQQDKKIIVKELCGGKEFDEINSLELHLSDEHISGKTVVRVCLDNGCVVYYKPKELYVSRYYQEIYAWIMGKCGEKAFSYPMVCRKAYGWEKEIVPMPCLSEMEVEKYYKNIGIHLSLAYVLGVTDIHFENVIAHGEYPVLADIEFLTNIGCSAFTEKERLQDYLDDNILSTGLLPVSAWLGGDNNVSGTGDTEGQRIPVKMPVVLHKGTADMVIGYDHPVIKPGTNIPVLGGKKCSYREYTGQIAEGFERGYDCILKNKDEFIAKFQYGFCYASRVLMRNTQEYSMYGNMLNFPEMMQDESKRMKVLHHMDYGLMCRGEYREGILEYEMSGVYKGEIPVFYAKGTSLAAGSGEVFENYYCNDTGKRIIKHIDKLSEKNKEMQKKIINVQFYNLSRREGIERVHHDAEFPVLSQLTPEKIADSFVRNMWDINGKYEWATLKYLTSDICLGTADDYLYNGICGMALFFAPLSKKYRDSMYGSIFDGIVRRIKLHTDDGLKSGDHWEWGLFTGETSIIYTYLRLYEILGDEGYLAYAQKHADRLMEEDISKIDEDDLLSGKAGVIIAYLELYSYIGNRSYLDFAASAAELLLAGAQKKERGIGWFNAGKSDLAGISHGNSGIALAFAFLWKYCKSEKYMVCIKEAIAYEDSLYDAKLHNWLDIREYQKYGTGKDMAAWCHGCGGVFLARKQIHEQTGIPMEELFDIMREKDESPENYEGCMWKALEVKLFSAKKEHCCLCHGALGIYSILKQINEEKAEEYWEEIQHQCLSFEDMNNIGFMNGMAGIGYTLLNRDDRRLPGLSGII